MRTPVAFIIFNRPEKTARVFAEIARARPKRLFVIADGPRPDHPGEAEKCLQARRVVENVDWDCEVMTRYSDENLGCRRGISAGLDWVFETVEEAIVLEDDCLPHPTFFPYCEALLDRFRDDERVGAISGGNYQGGRRRTAYSYYFSRYLHVWGWASWRRAWRHFDVEMKHWPELRDTLWLADLTSSVEAARYWRAIFDAVYEESIDAWDIQWLFACWAHNALAIVPELNLVSNIGFGADATHTTTVDPAVAALPAVEMESTLRHPPLFMRQREADDYESRHVFRVGEDGSSLYRRLRRRLGSVIRAGA